MIGVSPMALARSGILGMNCRNVSYIGRYNPRRLFPLVDNKLRTKFLAEKAGVVTPRLYYVIQHQYEISRVGQLLARIKGGFAIKPAKGSGGKGILVIIGRRGENFVKASGVEVTLEDIERHLTNTLAGLYSLSGSPDVVIIEELIEFDPVFAGYSHEGVPDIRIIVFKGYPVMAMLRLATHASDGKANLHQGAVGVGLDIATGRCLNAVQFSKPIKQHPDTGMGFDKIQVPNWPVMLNLAARCYEMTGLGYIGTDLVLDAKRGPLLLELNARPGLAIQVANGCGLLPRLRHIESLAVRHDSPERRVRYAMQEFATAAPEIPNEMFPAMA